MKTSNYNAFAKYYDELTSDVDYAEIAAFINSLIKKYSGMENGILLDLACGTGSISAEMARLGYDVIGLDYSCDMLSIAMDKKITHGYDIQYICQDMTDINLYDNIDIAVCVLDSLNHLDSLEDVKAVFNGVHKFLSNDGIFIFDMNTPFKHECILSDNIFTFETENVFCIWENNYFDDECEVCIRLDFFEKDNGIYRRYHEEFSEFAYNNKYIEDALKLCRFETLGCFNEYSDNAPNNETQRIVFAVRKAR